MEQQRYWSVFSWQRIKKSFRYAFRGVRELFLHTPNAHIHLRFTVAVLLFALLFGVSKMEWLVILLCIAMVLALEAVNTAIEKLSDEVTREYRPLIRDAKDLAAGAVLIAAIVSAIIGLSIFLPYLYQFFI